jgi:hypothetical protein
MSRRRCRKTGFIELKKSLLFAFCLWRAELIVRTYRALLPIGVEAYCSKSDSWENDLLLLLFNNTNAANIGDATGLRGSSTAGSLYVSLHTSDPGESGSQTTNETAYTGYARVALARSSGGFTVTTNSVSLAANVDFGECTASAGSPITHFGIGTASSGAGKLLYSGTVTPNITMAVGVIPRLKTTSTITED